MEEIGYLHCITWLMCVICALQTIPMGINFVKIVLFTLKHIDWKRFVWGYFRTFQSNTNKHFHLCCSLLVSIITFSRLSMCPPNLFMITNWLMKRLSMGSYLEA